jgi:hypothetical protein
VIDAPKSPASVVRIAVVKRRSMFAALALQEIFHDRVRISTTTADAANRCASSGREIELPARHQRTTKKIDTPTTAAKDAAVNAQRLHDIGRS